MVFLNVVLALVVVAVLVTIIFYAIRLERKYHAKRRRRVDPEGNVFGP